MASGHDHSHGAHAGHGHGPSPGEANLRRFAIVLVLTAVFMVAEAVGGWYSNSLALLADAGHMLSDVGALGLSLFAIWIARKPPNSRQTYGFQRTEILAALINGATLIAISIYIFVEAWHRLHAPQEVKAPLMMAVAFGGLVVNVGALFILQGGRSDNLNVRGAWLHTLADALGSLQAILAGGLIWAFGWRLADPIASALIGLLVLWSSWSLVKETVGVLMESAPGHIDVDEVRQAILAVDDVRGVHDLHVWTITSGRESLSAHVVTAEGPIPRSLLAEIKRALHDRFGIHHVTIQVEAEGNDSHDPCRGCDT
ncbi:MAG: cobalt-zinc-cadmium efflux system protein [Acidobacteriota bacterium]|jgi:cobalt-zinc-cadmium efflux system protein|nr:cobalt-zinc-cadmium efflux system protein [Acidobacteriota bacterium]